MANTSVYRSDHVVWRAIRQCVIEFLAAHLWIIPTLLVSTAHFVDNTLPDWYQIAIVTAMAHVYTVMVFGALPVLHPFFILNYILFDNTQQKADFHKHRAQILNSDVKSTRISVDFEHLTAFQYFLDRVTIGVPVIAVMFLGMLSSVGIVYGVNGSQNVVETAGVKTQIWNALLIEFIFSTVFASSMYMLRDVYDSDLCTHTPGNAAKPVKIEQALIVGIVIFLYVISTGPFTGGNFNIGLLFAKAAAAGSSNVEVWYHMLVQGLAFALVGLGFKYKQIMYVVVVVVVAVFSF